MDLDAYLAKKQKAAPAPEPVGGVDLDGYLKKRTGTAKIPPKPPEILQEQHPAFSIADRFVVKNFSNNQEDAENYLKSKHPNLEVKGDGKGQYFAREKGSQEPYKVLDPDTGIGFNTELISDTGDILYDSLAGIGTGLATAAGGVAGGIAGLGVGSVPGALLGAGAAGAASGGLLEGIRQDVGKMFGVNKGYEGTDIALATGMGAVSPLLMGTGAGAKPMASALLKRGLTDSLPDLALAQRGLIGRGKDWAAPKAMSMASGVGQEAIQNLGEFLPALKQLEKVPDAVRQMGQDARGNLGKIFRNDKKASWAVVENGLDNATDRVDVEPLARDLFDEINNAKASGLNNSEQMAYIQRLDKLFEDTFRDKVTGKVLTELPAREADMLRQQLANVAELSNIKPGQADGVGNSYAQSASFQDKAAGQIAKRLHSDLSDRIDSVLPPEAVAARARYKQTVGLEKETKPLLATRKKAYKTLSNLSSGPNQAEQELFSMIDTQYPGANLIDQAKRAEVYKSFAKPKLLPLSSEGSTSTSRTIGLSALGGSLGYYAGQNVGDNQKGEGYMGALAGMAAGNLLGGPAAMRAYITGSGLMNNGRQRIQNVAPGFMNAIPNAWLSMQP